MRGKASPLVLAVLAAALTVMFAASLYQRLHGPGLTLAPRHTHPPTASQAPENGNTASGIWQAPAGLSPEDSAQLGQLMARLQASPRDVPTLLDIAAIFTRYQDWDRAQGFLTRAANADPANARVLHLKGLNHVRKGDYPAAVSAFEAALERGKNASVSYSLAVLFQRYMREPDRARPLLERLLNDPDTPADIRERAERDLREMQ